MQVIITYTALCNVVQSTDSSLENTSKLKIDSYILIAIEN